LGFQHCSGFSLCAHFMVTKGNQTSCALSDAVE